ncbi:MAG: HepT-like ribonuclease domain-containing protein [Egibacteraceae bacterium]
MVDTARLHRLLAAMATELEVLATLAERDDDVLRTDPTTIRAVKYAFVVAIEAAIDAAEHVISSEGLRIPESFADAFHILHEHGLLDDELAGSMANAARFRNLLVHGYADVDDGRVLEILRSRPADLAAYRRVVGGLAGALPPEN